jgi:hypothetical protein
MPAVRQQPEPRPDEQSQECVHDPLQSLLMTRRVDAGEKIATQQQLTLRQRTDDAP